MYKTTEKNVLCVSQNEELIRKLNTVDNNRRKNARKKIHIYMHEDQEQHVSMIQQIVLARRYIGAYSDKERSCKYMGNLQPIAVDAISLNISKLISSPVSISIFKSSGVVTAVLWRMVAVYMSIIYVLHPMPLY